MIYHHDAWGVTPPPHYDDERGVNLPPGSDDGDMGGKLPPRACGDVLPVYGKGTSCTGVSPCERSHSDAALLQCARGSERSDRNRVMHMNVYHWHRYARQQEATKRSSSCEWAGPHFAMLEDWGRLEQCSLVRERLVRMVFVNTVRERVFVNSVRDPGSRIQVPRCWNPGSRFQNSRIQAPGSRILDPGSWIQDPDSIQDPGSRIQAPGSQLQDPGFWT